MSVFYKASGILLGLTCLFSGSVMAATSGGFTNDLPRATMPPLVTPKHNLPRFPQPHFPRGGIVCMAAGCPQPGTNMPQIPSTRPPIVCVTGPCVPSGQLPKQPPVVPVTPQHKPTIVCVTGPCPGQLPQIPQVRPLPPLHPEVVPSTPSTNMPLVSSQSVQPNLPD